MTVEMHVPNKLFSGFYGGVKFNRGVGVFEDEAAARELAKRYGYEIKEINSTKNSTVNSTKESTKQEEVKEVVEEKPKRKPRKQKTQVGD